MPVLLHIKQGTLMTTQKITCTVIDAGARYGIHPTWKNFLDVIQFHLFEIDSTETKRLSEMYASYPNIKIHNHALHSTKGHVKFKLRQHKGLTSLYDSNFEIRKKTNYMMEESDYAEEEKEIEAVAIDHMFKQDPVHFLKLDTEGSELEILKGAEAKLGTTVLGIRTEINFEEIYKGIPLFGEIHSFLRKHNFDLLNLDYDGRGHNMSAFTMPDRYGYLLGGEGVWIKNIDTILNQPTGKMSRDIILLALFLLNNHATDVCLHLLQRALKEKQINLRKFDKDPVFFQLKKDISFLFKDLISLPAIDEDSIYDTYRKIFNCDFPKWNKFYETFSI
jgi:FkbM family methyltransferase